MASDAPVERWTMKHKIMAVMDARFRRPDTPLVAARDLEMDGCP